MALSHDTVKTVKQSVPALKQHGAAIVLEFYDILFQRYPSVKRHFNMDRQKGGSSVQAGVPAQVAALGNAVIAYAENIDNIPALLPTVERIAHKHISRGVKSNHYNAVGECLLAAMQVVLKDAATEALMNAWKEAYFFLADTFRSTEENLLEQLSDQAGYEGSTEMKVTAIENTENGNRNISLVPVNVPVPKTLPGQFVAISVKGAIGEDMMCTVKINSDVKDCLSVYVRASKEAAAVYLFEKVEVGSLLNVSMPCGRGRVEKS